MTFTPFATQQQVVQVETAIGDNSSGLTQKVNTVETTVGDSNSGLVKEVADINTTVGTNDTEGLRKRIADNETAIGDNSSGLTKQVNDLDNQINATGTGLDDRVTDLENAESGTQILTHNSSGVYQQGDVVEASGILFRANSNIDGSTTPVSLVVGSGSNTWTPIGRHYPKYSIDLLTDDNASLAAQLGIDTNGLTLVSTDNTAVTGGTVGVTLNTTRKRLTLGTSGDPDDLTDPDLLTKADYDDLSNSAPVGEVFCVGVLECDLVDSATDAGSVTAHGFKWSTPTIGDPSYSAQASNMDYVEFTISDYIPTGSTISAIWTEHVGTERDNIAFAVNTLTSGGTAGTIRVYSADNSDWSGDNTMGFDDQVVFVKIMAVASA